jgi:RHS repeat-associated protein
MANGKSIAAVVQDANGNAQLQYLYTDYLGSLLLTTDDQGNPLHEQNFDAWGNQRDPNTWQPLPGAPQPALGDRGYTFHEHLPQFALINMNGRVYDPVLGRFLSPDPYVQAPTNTQNYNRYSYVLNNPLKYTDPSGNLIAELLTFAGMVLFANNVANAFAAGGWSAVGQQVALAGLSFGVGIGVGGMVGALVNSASPFLNATAQVLAGGLTGGIMSSMSGGNFWNGAIYGAAGAALGVAARYADRTISIARASKSSKHMQDANGGVVPTDANLREFGEANVHPDAYKVGWDKGNNLTTDNIPLPPQGATWYVDQNGNLISDGIQADAITTQNSDNPGGSSNTYVSKSAFKSVKVLWITLNHEAGHAWLNYAYGTFRSMHFRIDDHLAIGSWEYDLFGSNRYNLSDHQRIIGSIQWREIVWLPRQAPIF